MTPQRIQQRRTAGWRKPENTIAVGRGTRWGNPYRVGHEAQSNNHAVELFRTYLADHPDLVTAIREHLAGADLMCWCPPDKACHADVLLAIANPSA